MADYTHSVTHSFAIADAVGMEREKADPVACLAGDYKYTFGRVMIRVERESGAGINALAGEYEHPDEEVMNVLAKVSLVTDRDLQQSRAMLRVGDTKFRVTAADCSFLPTMGDKVYDESGQKYEVLGVGRVAFATRYILWCRDAS